MRNIFSKAPADLNRQVTIRTGRDRRRMVQRLDDGLARLAERVGQPYVITMQIQLVIQVCGDQSYSNWKRDREKTWSREGGTFSTKYWPASLRLGDCGAVLLPLRAGRVSTTARDHPPLIASPRFTYGRLRADMGADDAVLSVLTSWVTDPGFGVTARLAPPIVESVFQGQIVERRIESFDLDWPLPPVLDLA